MARERNHEGAAPETVISIIGPGMKVVGDCQTDGTIRVEGSVEGSIRAGKAVVVGKEGRVDGDIVTQDAVMKSKAKGTESLLTPSFCASSIQNQKRSQASLERSMTLEPSAGIEPCHMMIANPTAAARNIFT